MFELTSTESLLRTFPAQSCILFAVICNKDAKLSPRQAQLCQSLQANGRFPNSTSVISQRVGTFGRFRQHFKSSSLIYFVSALFRSAFFGPLLQSPLKNSSQKRSILIPGPYLNMLALFLKLPTAHQELNLTYISTCWHFLPLGGTQVDLSEWV